MPLNVPNRIAALLYEHNDEVTKSARYVKTWPISSDPNNEPATPEQQEEFYKRHGDCDAKLGENRISEDGKLDPREFVFFEPEDEDVCVNPQICSSSGLAQYEKLLMLEQEGVLSLANAFAYLLRRARVMRYESCISMLTGLKNYHRHVFLSQSQRHHHSPNSTLDFDGARDDMSIDDEVASPKLPPGDPALHMPLKDVVEACLELEIWVSTQAATFHNEQAMADRLGRSLDPKLVKLLDQQLDLCQRELLLRAVDIFTFPQYYKDLSDQYLEVVHDGIDLLGFTQEELEGMFPRRPVYNLGVEDKCRVTLYRRIVSQAIDSYFYDDCSARMELWAMGASPVCHRRWRETGSMGGAGQRKECMRYIAAKPMGDLTDTRVPGVVYIATERGVQLIAIKRSWLLSSEGRSVY